MERDQKEIRMKLKFLKATFLSLIFTASSFVHAGIIVFDDRNAFESYLSSYQVDDFEDFVTGVKTNPLVRNDFTIDGSTYQAHATYPYSDSLAHTKDTGYLWNYAVNSDTTITFENGFNAIGFDFTQIHYANTSQVLNVMHEGVTYTSNALANNWKFFGLINTTGNIANVSFNHNPTYMGMDNVITGVHSTDIPEPSTLAIFALGMIGLASRRFKK